MKALTSKAGTDAKHLSTKAQPLSVFLGSPAGGNDQAEMQPHKWSSSLPPSSLPSKAQFIVVSHRPQVFEQAGCLVGVTSGPKPGASQAVVAYFHEQ
jgi:hypothetical protein